MADSRSHEGEELAFERGKNLYYLDMNADIRYSHENPDVQNLYDEYFEKPNRLNRLCCFTQNI